MSYLVDSQIFLWSLMSPKKISNKISKILNDPESTKHVSIFSFWEISLKFSLGKIDLVDVLPDELPDVAKKANFDILGVDVKTVSSYHKLPYGRNKDPFDRMLAWQAICNNYCLLSKDPGFFDYKPYGLKIVW